MADDTTPTLAMLAAERVEADIASLIDVVAEAIYAKAKEYILKTPHFATAEQSTTMEDDSEKQLSLLLGKDTYFLKLQQRVLARDRSLRLIRLTVACNCDPLQPCACAGGARQLFVTWL